MPTDLFLIRHGHAIPVNRRYLHAPLTPLGQQQATQTGQHLRELHPSLDALYTSPIRRARETAAIIGALIGKAPQARSGIEEMTLLELPALALLALLSLLDPVEDYLQRKAGRPLHWPIAGRVSRVLTEVLAGHPRQRVAMVAHNGVIGSTLAWLFPEQRLRWWTSIVGNCSLTQLRVDGARAELLAVNETGHLTPLLATTQPPAHMVRLPDKVVETKVARPPKRG